MKIDKEQAKQKQAPLTTFSKVGEIKEPDSPPPEKKEDEGVDGMTKFDQLMKAAVSIKSSQLDLKKKKFEKLPSFLKAGVYYTTKLETVRKQDFHQRLFAFELIRNEANQDFSRRNFDRACRKYEEAYSIFRYFYSTNPKWSEQGIDDSELREVDFLGQGPAQQSTLRGLKLQTLLNIAACCLKTKDFASAEEACEEALRIDAGNPKAYYRKARALSLPINAGVEEFKKALVCLQKCEELGGWQGPVQRERQKLEKLVKINRKREHETYGKMFQGKSVSDYVTQKMQNQPKKSCDDREYEEEKRKMDEKVKLMMEQKMMEFSFEVKEEKKHYPEMDDIQDMIDKAEESYKLFKKTGRIQEAKEIKERLEEAKFAKEHFAMVMNLDFSRPTPKMQKMAQEHGIDLKDPLVLDEFRKIQKQNLEDVRRMKEGKKPLTEEETKQKMQEEREAKYKLAQNKYEEQQREKEEQVRDLIQSAMESKSNSEKELKDAIKSTQQRHYLVLFGFFSLWVAFIYASNYFAQEQQQPSLI